MASSISCSNCTEIFAASRSPFDVPVTPKLKELETKTSAANGCEVCRFIMEAYAHFEEAEGTIFHPSFDYGNDFKIWRFVSGDGDTLVLEAHGRRIHLHVYCVEGELLKAP
jgi:hypothetical protein